MDLANPKETPVTKPQSASIQSGDPVSKSGLGSFQGNSVDATSAITRPSRPKNHDETTSTGETIANANQDQTLQIGYLIHVSQEDLDEFITTISNTGVNFHPVENQIHIDFDSDLNSPNTKMGDDLSSTVQNVNEFLQQQGWTPLIPEPNEGTEPIVAAEILEVANLWFEWAGLSVTGFHRGTSQADWEEFVRVRPRTFQQTQ